MKSVAGIFSDNRHRVSIMVSDIYSDKPDGHAQRTLSERYWRIRNLGTETTVRQFCTVIEEELE